MNLPSKATKAIAETPEEQMKQILNDLGIEIVIWGCGCCESPTVSFKYKGNVIVNDQGYFEFDNSK